MTNLIRVDHDRVSYVIAHKLNALGFNLQEVASQSTPVYTPEGELSWYANFGANYSVDEYIMAPTQDTVVRWLDEVHGLFVEASKHWQYSLCGHPDYDDKAFYGLTVRDFRKRMPNREDHSLYIWQEGDYVFTSHRDALRHGIEVAIKILEDGR
jgi:hypothetical protein